MPLFSSFALILGQFFNLIMAVHVNIFETIALHSKLQILDLLGERDYLSVSQSCKSWLAAGLHMKFPISYLKIDGSGGFGFMENISITWNGICVHNVPCASFQMKSDQTLIESKWPTSKLISRTTSVLVATCAANHLLEICSTYRVKRIGFSNMKGLSMFDFATKISQNMSKPLYCDYMSVINSSGEITAQLVECFKANRYYLSSNTPSRPWPSLKITENMLKCQGNIEIIGFDVTSEIVMQGKSRQLILSGKTYIDFEAIKEYIQNASRKSVNLNPYSYLGTFRLMKMQNTIREEFKAIALDVKRQILQLLTVRDFIAVSQTCKSWREAGFALKFPIGCLQIEGAKANRKHEALCINWSCVRINNMLPVNLQKHGQNTDVLFNGSFLWRQLVEKSLGNYAADYAIEICSTYRVKQVYFNETKGALLAEFATALAERLTVPINCNCLYIENTLGDTTLKLVEIFKARRYFLSSINRIPLMNLSKNILDCKGKIEIVNFDVSGEILTRGQSRQLIVKGKTNIDLVAIKEYIKNWQNGTVTQNDVLLEEVALKSDEVWDYIGKLNATKYVSSFMTSPQGLHLIQAGSTTITNIHNVSAVVIFKKSTKRIRKFSFSLHTIL